MRGPTRLDRLTTVQAIELLERLLNAHGFYSGPECQPLRCECAVCADLHAMFDEKQEYEEAHA